VDFGMEDLMPPKKPTRAKSPASPKKTTRIAAETRPEPTTGETQGPTAETRGSTRMMGVGAIVVVFCVMTAAMLLSARETPAPAATADERADTAVTVGSTTNTSKPAADARPATTTVAADASKSLSAKSSSVTITGCLARTDTAFRLTDTDGSDAPRSRSWKSGFLRKGTASVNVVDSARKLRLASHVGQRVSVTGVLEDREMQVRSLRQIAPACN
jgi:hypothetical protein